jgi:DNA polymerase III sliding clamp (beta) subunit (PCNA family)
MSISRKEAIAALELVKPAVATRSAIQELSHVWFDGEHISATNGGLGIRAQFKSPFKCGIPGALLLGLLNQASSDKVEFKQSGEGFKFGRITLNTLPLEQFPWRYPDKPKAKPIAQLKLSAELIGGLKRVTALKISGPKRMEHYAVCIFAARDEIELYVTDSKSMLVMPVDEPLTGTAKKIALPRELADQIIARCKPGQALNMYSDHFAVVADKVQLFSNVFDTSEMLDLPAFADNLIDEKKFPSVALPSELNAVLERVMVLAGSEDPLVAFKSEGKVLKLWARFKYGEVSEEFALDKALLKTTLSLNARTVLGIKDVTKFSFSERAVAFLGKDDFTYVLATQDQASPPVSPEEEGEGNEPEASLPPNRGKNKPRSTSAKEKAAAELAADIADLDDDIPF